MYKPQHLHFQIDFILWIDIEEYVAYFLDTEVYRFGIMIRLMSAFSYSHFFVGSLLTSTPVWLYCTV